MIGTNISGGTLEITNFGSATNKHTITSDEYEKAGLKASNYQTGTWYINTSTGRACVELTRSTTGEYNDADDNGGVAKSTGCSTTSSSSSSN